MRSQVLPHNAKEILYDCLPMVCEFWGVTSKQVLSKKRQRKIINARHSLRFFLSTINDLSSCDIATLLDCDHSSVIHSVKTFETLCLFEQDYRDFRDIVLKDNIKNWDYRVNRGIKKVILSDYHITKKVDLIKKIFNTNENR